MEQVLASLPMILLVSSRIAGVTAASPVFSSRFMVAPLRVFFTILLGLLIYPTIHPQPPVTQGAQLLITVFLELIVGITIGFLGQLVFAAVHMAGSLLDMDFGLAMAQVFDPVSNRSEPLLGSFFQTFSLVVYFTLNAHHWLIRALADSYALIPIGTLGAQPGGFMFVVSVFGGMLTAAVKMVLPFIATMLVATVVFAVMNRAVQQMQVFHIGLGIKTVLGLAVLALVLPLFLSFLESLFSGGHAQLIRTLELMGPVRGE